MQKLIGICNWFNVVYWFWFPPKWIIYQFFRPCIQLVQQITTFSLQHLLGVVVANMCIREQSRRNQCPVVGCCPASWFFFNFILNWKCRKCSLNRGTLVSATATYQMKCPFTVLNALFWFFWTLPYDSRLFPVYGTDSIIPKILFILFKSFYSINGDQLENRLKPLIIANL